MNPPNIKIGSNKILTSNNGTFMIRDPVMNPKTLKNWILIYPRIDKHSDGDVDDFVDQLIKASKAFGIRVEKPYFLVLNDTINSKDWKAAIDDDIKKNGLPSFILSWIPSDGRGKLYSNLKRICYQDLGIPH